MAEPSSTSESTTGGTSINKPEMILLDIEGTMTNAMFVSKTLFPFIERNIKEWLIDTYDHKESREMVDRLRKSQIAFPELPRIPMQPREMVIVRVNDYASKLIQLRKRISEVKQLQILVWVWGYQKKTLRGHVYDEVTTCMHYWKKRDRIIMYVFSSGMIAAQKLLLCCTNHGNCLPLLSGFFDNSTGEKTEKDSYQAISAELCIPVHRILFLTDSPKEAIAAEQAGYNVMVVRRPDAYFKDNIPLTQLNISIIDSFDRISWSTSF